MLNDEYLKKYFLGKIPPTQAEHFEEEIALSAELTERAQIVESELVDDYLCGNLSLPERILFETNYLTTTTRQENLKFARNLWDNLSNYSQTPVLSKTNTQTSFWQNWYFLRIGFASLIMLFSLGAFFFFWINYDHKSEIARLENINKTVTPKNEDQNLFINENKQDINNNFNTDSKPIDLSIQNTQDKNTKISPQMTVKKTTPTISAPLNKIKANPKIEYKINLTNRSIDTVVNTQNASLGNNFVQPLTTELPTENFVLLPKTLRGDGEQFIKISPNIKKISLSLTLPKSASKYQTYAATIKTADGETVFTFPDLKSFNLTLPADKLEIRTYVIFLEGQNAQNTSEPIAEYTFRVRR